MSTEPKVSEYAQMKLRLSPELKALIDDAAKASNRTLNAEIIARLETTFKGGMVGCGFNESRMREMLREELREALFWGGDTNTIKHDS